MLRIITTRNMPISGKQKSNKVMSIPPSIALRLSEFVLRRRWHIMILISLIVVVVEASAHFGNAEGQNTVLWDFTFEVGVLGITLPLLGGFTLTLLNRVRDERSQADQQREISRKLATVDDWDQLTTMLVDLPKSILPIVSSALYIYNAVLG